MQLSHATQGLAALSRTLAEGHVSAEALAREALGHIEALAPTLNAFTHVDAERAIAAARAVDAQRSRGVALGPLAGLPIAIKDLFTVDGMPTRAGSLLDIQDLVPAQGSLVTGLVDSGCVTLGKTRTTEFALGGFNLNVSPPWNPCDLREQRMTGGSSHGSAVAMAAGLAAFVEAAIAQRALGDAPPIDALRFAIPREHFLANLEAPVAACFDAAVKRLRDAGARLVELPVPEATWIDDIFGSLVPADLLAFLGRERVERGRAVLDPVAATRLDGGFKVTKESYAQMLALRRKAEQLVNERSHGIDAWISPTVPVLPHPIANYQTVADVAAWNRLATQNTRPGNLFGQCGVSLPIQHLGADLPVGLQLCASRGQDVQLLGVARAVEALLAP